MGFGDGPARKKRGQPGHPPARGTRTMRMCSSDARTRGSTRPPPEKERRKLGKRGWSLMIFCARATRALGGPSPGLMARLRKSIASNRGVGRDEVYLSVGRGVRKWRGVGADESGAPTTFEGTPYTQEASEHHAGHNH